MKKILIIEDNKRTCDTLAKIIKDTCESAKVFPLNKVEDAYRCALENTIDLFIVDIILEADTPGDASGIRFVESMRQIKGYRFVPVIIVTSLEDPKLYAYENLHCYGYIEKPFDPRWVKKLVLESLEYSDRKEQREKLYFRKDGILVTAARDEIAYLKVVNHVGYIHLANHEVSEIPYLTLKKFMEMVDSDDFIRCSRNFVVNKNYISNVDNVNRYITLIDNLGMIEIGVVYRKIFKRHG